MTKIRQINEKGDGEGGRESGNQGQESPNGSDVDQKEKIQIGIQSPGFEIINFSQEPKREEAKEVDQFGSENQEGSDDREEQQGEQHFYKFDDQSLKPSSIPCEDQDGVSEVSNQELFGSKKMLSPTDFGSPTANCFQIEADGEMIKQLYLYQMEFSQLSRRMLMEKSKIRKEKVERYLQKKLHRNYIKRVSYHSRKTVAQSRLRIKGRFINRIRAEEILGLDLSWMCNKEIKHLLSEHQ